MIERIQGVIFTESQIDSVFLFLNGCFGNFSGDFGSLCLTEILGELHTCHIEHFVHGRNALHQAGKKIRGVVGYQAPADWETVELQFSPSFWSYKKMIFTFSK